MRQLILLLAALCFASSALAADNLVDPVLDHAGCSTWTLCDDQAASGACVTGSNQNVIRASNQYTWSAWADTSDETTGPWTIKIYDKAPGAGYSTVRTLVNSTDMAQDAMKFSWNGISGDIHAVLAGTLTGGVTLVIKGCAIK